MHILTTFNQIQPTHIPVIARKPIDQSERSSLIKCAWNMLIMDPIGSFSEIKNPDEIETKSAYKYNLLRENHDHRPFRIQQSH